MNERRGTSEELVNLKPIHQFYELGISGPARFPLSATSTPSFLSFDPEPAGDGSNQRSH